MRRSKPRSAPLDYRNLDDLPQFKGINTTTEFVTKYVFDQLAEAARAGKLGRDGRELAAIRITVAGIALGQRLVRGAVVVKAAAFAVPGDLATPTGGYAYDRRIIAELRALGWQMQVLDIGEGFPRPTAAARSCRAARSIAALPAEHPIVIDGLAFGVLAEEARALAPGRTGWSPWCIIRWRWNPD